MLVLVLVVCLQRLWNKENGFLKDKFQFFNCRHIRVDVWCRSISQATRWTSTSSVDEIDNITKIIIVESCIGVTIIIKLPIYTELIVYIQSESFKTLVSNDESAPLYKIMSSVKRNPSINKAPYDLLHFCDSLILNIWCISICLRR